MAASPSCPVMANRSQAFWFINFKALLRHKLHGNPNIVSFYFLFSLFMGSINKVFLSTFYISSTVIHWVKTHNCLQAAHFELNFSITERGHAVVHWRGTWLKWGVCLWSGSLVRELPQKEKVELIKWRAERCYWHRVLLHKGTGRQSKKYFGICKLFSGAKHRTHRERQW